MATSTNTIKEKTAILFWSPFLILFRILEVNSLNLLDAC